ncbi:hypothetical protein RMCBS344292_00087 [Rhizopus microsporus]|nr:hypothetical protein RMCBS344292_00087 [Rhizopus microsporus]
MQIFVTTVFRSVIVLNVDSFESIDTIKQKINEKLNISDPEYSLSFHGRMLKNIYNLRDYDIRIGSTLQMATSLRGGSSYPNPPNNGKGSVLTLNLENDTITLTDVDDNTEKTRKFFSRQVCRKVLDASEDEKSNGKKRKYQHIIKVRCSLELCTSAYVKIIGDCNYCQAKYCSRHRLPEDHACYNMNVCKQLAHRRNSEKLLNEYCVASKVNNL